MGGEAGALIALVGFVAYVGYQTNRGTAATSVHWIAPAVLGLLFAAYSLYTVAVAGVSGVWAEHVNGLWGNQIWFDLLLALGLGWTLLLPRATAVGMRRWPWLVALLLSGCVGLLLMWSRLLFLEQQAQPAAESA